MSSSDPQLDQTVLTPTDHETRKDPEPSTPHCELQGWYLLGHRHLQQHQDWMKDHFSEDNSVFPFRVTLKNLEKTF